MGRML
jgi:hypothetical protein